LLISINLAKSPDLRTEVRTLLAKKSGSLYSE
jgi:hypothetical protein